MFPRFPAVLVPADPVADLVEQSVQNFTMELGAFGMFAQDWITKYRSEVDRIVREAYRRGSERERDNSQPTETAERSVNK